VNGNGHPHVDVAIVGERTLDAWALRQGLTDGALLGLTVAVVIAGLTPPTTTLLVAAVLSRALGAVLVRRARRRAPDIEVVEVVAVARDPSGTE
jgi:hypothetical protein